MMSVKKEKQQKKSYIIFGCSGAGKSTFARYLKNNMGYHHVSTGALARAEINQDTLRGKIIGERVKNDELIPDKLFNEVVRDYLINFSSGDKPFVLEGYPQTYGQAIYLISLIQSAKKLKSIVLIHFDVSQLVALQRISSRLFCKNCLATFNEKNISDKICLECQKPLSRSFLDRQENAEKRLATFLKNMKNVVELFSQNPGINFINFRSSKDCTTTSSDYGKYIRSLI